MNFDLTILGSGSAIPAHGRFSSAQWLQTHGKAFLIDCADGTQFQLRQAGLVHHRLGHIFISHLHGDHSFGLLALLSTLSMLHHTMDIYIHAHPLLESLLRPMLDFYCGDLGFKVMIEPFDPLQHTLIYEDRSLQVSTLPLVHTMPTCGFLFREKEKTPHLNKEMLDFYQVPLAQLLRIKEGADFVTPEGKTVPNARFLLPPTPSHSYAYCSDTAYSERLIPWIEGVDCLFHEATYGQDDLSKAKQYLHSTTAQAATIAQKARVKQLLIGHFSARYPDLSPLLEEARAIFPATELATDLCHFQW